MDPTLNSTLIYSTTTTNILYDCSALTAMKGNHTTGGEDRGIIFPTFSLLSRGTVLLESSTEDCFESAKNMPYDPQTTCYLNLARNCENSIYWYPYKFTGKLRRYYRKLLKRRSKETPPIQQAIQFEIWRIKALRKRSSFPIGLFPIQLVLQGILLTSTFISDYWPSSNAASNNDTLPPSPSPSPAPIKESKLPVTLVSDNVVPSNIQIFVKFQDPNGRPYTKTTMIRNNDNLLNLRSSIQLIFPQLIDADYYLTLNGKILNDHTLLCFQDLAFKTIEVQLRLRGGMMQPEEVNGLMQMMKDLAKRLEESLALNATLQQRIENLEESKKLEKEIDDELDTSDADDPFTTPTRTKAPSFKVDDVQRTPFLKRSKKMSGKHGETISTSAGTPSTTTTTSTDPSTDAYTSADTSSSTHTSAGTPSSTTSKKDRGFKPVTNADLKVYQVGHSWEAWYRRFQFVANSCSWSDGEKVATLCHFMPEEIKEFLENLSADSFKDCESLSKILEDLFDLYMRRLKKKERKNF